MKKKISLQTNSEYWVDKKLELKRAELSSNDLKTYSLVWLESETSRHIL